MDHGAVMTEIRMCYCGGVRYDEFLVCDRTFISTAGLAEQEFEYAWQIQESFVDCVDMLICFGYWQFQALSFIHIQKGFVQGVVHGGGY